MDGETVTTIRVVNVPSSTTEAEFNCWFIFADGFEQAQLKATRGYGVSQLGWARFSSVEACQVAIQRLNGLKLSEHQSEENIVLSADMAKGNFRPNALGNKRPRYEEAPIQHMPVQQMPIYKMPLQQQAYTPAPAPYQSPPSWTSSAPAGGSGSTLVVGGLVPECTEDELYEFFGNRFHGFQKMKFIRSGGKPGMCFVKFETYEHAFATYQALGEGIDCLPSNPNVALRPEWAKNDLDVPRDAGGAQWAPSAPRAYVAAPPPPPQQVHWSPPPQQVHWNAPAPQNAQVLAQTPPGDTLFIGNLAAGVQEDELQNTLSGFAGYVRMKMSGQHNSPTAFALFDSVHSCTDALSKLRGMALPSSPQQAMNCEFARNSLDKRSRY